MVDLCQVEAEAQEAAVELVVGGVVHFAAAAKLQGALWQISRAELLRNPIYWTSIVPLSQSISMNCSSGPHSHPKTRPTPPDMGGTPSLVGQHAGQGAPPYPL